jgi:hypothetical protein
VKREPPLNAPACFAGGLLKGIPALQGREEVNAGIVNVVGLLGFEHQAITHLTGTTSLLGAALGTLHGAQALHLEGLGPRAPTISGEGGGWGGGTYYIVVC